MLNQNEAEWNDKRGPIFVLKIGPRWVRRDQFLCRQVTDFVKLSNYSQAIGGCQREVVFFSDSPALRFLTTSAGWEVGPFAGEVSR